MTFPPFSTVRTGFLTHGDRLADRVGLGLVAAVACRVMCWLGRLARGQLVSLRCRATAGRWRKSASAQRRTLVS